METDEATREGTFQPKGSSFHLIYAIGQIRGITSDSLTVPPRLINPSSTSHVLTAERQRTWVKVQTGMEELTHS